ncbi:helix-turn-helix domain-containing protein [Streptomyces sp. NPDC047886]|uniref:helix-turn-helix domain-containing protein n=1 Tax=Streptomyces sp. NPDC047886 TaxID=3365490 RepID=UPI0037109AF8
MVEGEGAREGPAQRLGSALRALQQRSGRTLRSLETEVMISDSSLSRYFRGSTVPPWATVRDLCRALKADPAEYRALWEAADRAQPRPPVDTGPTTGPPGPGTRPHSATEPHASRPHSATEPHPAAEPETGPRPWRRALRARPAGRWACAVAGALTGALLGALLALVAASATGGTATRSGAQGDSPVSGGTVPRKGPEQPEGVRIFVSRATGRCLDDSLDYGLRSLACNGMSYQRWSVSAFTGSERRLRNHATGACLDHGAAGLRAVDCGSSRSQLWSVTTWSDESVELRNKATGRCLHDGGTGLDILPCDLSKHQKWG